MEVLAVRDKSLGWILSVLGVILIALCIGMISISKWYILILALGCFLLLIGLYFVALKKSAILFDGNEFIINFLFSCKRIKKNQIEFVSYNEIGEFYNRNGGLFNILYFLKNDIRTLNISVKINGSSKIIRIPLIKNSSATAVAINTLISKS